MEHHGSQLALIPGEGPRDVIRDTTKEGEHRRVHMYHHLCTSSLLLLFNFTWHVETQQLRGGNTLSTFDFNL